MRELGVVITGAGDSVGRVTAEKFLKAGARVHICDVREQAVRDTLAANPGMGGTVCDVGHEPDVVRLFSAAVKDLGKVDVLVNCVGIAGPHAALEEIDSEDWQNTLQVNVTGMFYTMKMAIPGMKQRRFGSIINFSTASTRSCLPHRAAYVVSKCAVEGLTRNSARELGPFNIRCNAILPGAIDNERLAMILQRVAQQKGISLQECEHQALKFNSMHTKIAPEELADVVLFLASDQAPHITGQLFEVSGGHEWEEG